jgi:hypothetical protein
MSRSGRPYDPNARIFVGIGEDLTEIDKVEPRCTESEHLA